MKIGIVTLFFPLKNDNYGGILQNYALQRVLKELGYDACTLCFIHTSKMGKVLYKIRILLYSRFGLEIEAQNRKVITIGEQKKRNDAFRLFVEKYIQVKNVWITNEKDYQTIDNEYDYFIVGSDQVWNSYWAFENDAWKEFLLSFTQRKKRISYAASFGTDDINEKYLTKFQKELKKFNGISVREEKGKEIVRQIVGLESEVLIDPTLLVHEDVWEKLVCLEQPLSLEEDYILTYFLGGVVPEAEKMIQNISKTYSMPVYNLLDKKQPDLFCIGPIEFLGLIKKAKIIITDSFHACVFSFIFERPYLVFDRENNGKGGNMNSRIDAFLSVFSMKRKYIHSNLENDLFECNYAEGKKRLELERERAKQYLNKLLEGR